MFANNIKQKYVFIFLTGLIIVSIPWFYFANLPIEGDSTHYFNGAKLIRIDISNLFNDKRIGIVEPLNLVFQGLIMYLPGNRIANVYFFQLIIYALTGVFIFKLTLQLLSEKYAWVVLVFYLINHAHWKFAYNFKPGVWVNFLLSLVLYYSFQILKENKNKKYFILFSVFAALLMLTDFRYSPHLILIIFLVLFSEKKMIYALRKGSVIFFVMILILTPWTIRQYYVYNRLLLISDLNTMTIHMALNTEKFKSLSKYTFYLNKLPQKEFDVNFMKIADSLNLTPGELIYSKVFATQSKNKDVKFYYNNPQHEFLIKKGVLTRNQVNYLIKQGEGKSKLYLLLLKGLSIWQPFQFNYVYLPWRSDKMISPPWSWKSNINRIITVGIFLPFLLIGIFYSFIKKHKFFIIIFIILLIHTFIHALSWATTRYLLTVLPYITILSLFGFDCIKNELFRALMKFKKN